VRGSGLGGKGGGRILYDGDAKSATHVGGAERLGGGEEKESAGTVLGMSGGGTSSISTCL